MAASISNPQSQCEVWIIRHGERIDETEEGDRWYYTTPRSRRFDPTLTKQGEIQAQQSANTLQQLLSLKNNHGNNQEPFFDTVYCSPMQRCLSTAHEVASTLNQSNNPNFHCKNGVVVIPGLGECAAAGRKHGVDNLQFLNPIEMMKICPSIKSEENCWDDYSPRRYESAVNWLTTREVNKTQEGNQQESNQPKRILIVAHREAIRDLTGSHSRIPYCAIALFHALSVDNEKINRSPSFDTLVDTFSTPVEMKDDSDDDSDVEKKLQINSYKYDVENVFHPETSDIVPLVTY